MTTSKKMVMVTTSRRGVFAGYVVGKIAQEKVVLRDARCCVHWRGTKGFLGLATEGPNAQCRVGPAAPKVTLWDITSVTEISDEARKAWEAEPWG